MEKGSIKGRTANGARMEVGWLKEKPWPPLPLRTKAAAMEVVADYIISRLEDELELGAAEETAHEAYRAKFPSQEPDTREMALLICALEFVLRPAKGASMESKTDREEGAERLKNRAANNDGDPAAPPPETDQATASRKIKRIRGLTNIEHRKE